MSVAVVAGQLREQPVITPTYKVFRGSDIEQCIQFVAEQRLSAFREFPYLYDGKLEQEYEYLRRFAACARSVFIIAYHGERPIGLVTGTPLCNFEADIPGSIELFQKNNLDPSAYYYLAECIVLPEYRGNRAVGPVHRVLAEMLNACVQEMGYAKACFITVHRENNYPCKPMNYRSVEALCVRNGFTKTAMSVQGIWDTIQPDGSVKKQGNEVVFWLKDL